MEPKRSKGCRINPAPADCLLSRMNVKGCASRPTAKVASRHLLSVGQPLDIHSSSQGRLVSGVNARISMLGR